MPFVYFCDFFCSWTVGGAGGDNGRTGREEYLTCSPELRRCSSVKVCRESGLELGPPFDIESHANPAAFSPGVGLLLLSVSFGFAGFLPFLSDRNVVLNVVILFSGLGVLDDLLSSVLISCGLGDSCAL